MNFDSFLQHINRVINEQNNRPLPEFEGYSPFEMRLILYDAFSSDSPLQLLKPADADYAGIPIFNQIKYLANFIAAKGELKLTEKGFLPTKIVAELYGQGFIKDKYIEQGFVKLYRETDSKSIHLTRILLELAKLVKKRNGKFSLTKASEKILSDNYELLKLIITTFATRFNWAYFDGYGDNKIGQLGWGFSLILLSKYGNERRLDSFYAEKYFKAFPQLLDSIEQNFTTVEIFSRSCYSSRTFERFLNYLGLISFNKENETLATQAVIIKTDLYDKLIKCTPHKRH